MRGCAAALPERASFLLEPFGRNTAPAVALAAQWIAAAPRRRRGAAGAARPTTCPRSRGLRGGGRARRAPRAGRRAGDVRHRSHASRDGLRLHRVRRGDRRRRAARVRGRPLRREAAAGQGARIRRRRQLRLELGDVLLHARRRFWPRSRGMRRTSSTRCARSRRRSPARAICRCWTSTPRCSPPRRTSRSTTRSWKRRRRPATLRSCAARSTGATSARGRRWPNCPPPMPTATAARASASRSPRTGTYVHAGDRVVATVGVENLVIVDTPDAVLVAHRDHLQRVKDVVGELKARGHESYRLHKTVARPWGAYTVLRGGARVQDQAHRGEARRRALAAAAPSPQRALGGRRRRRQGDARRGHVRRQRQRLDVHPGRDEASARESGERAAGDDRGPVRRLSRRGRHRPLRRQVRASA